MKITGFNPSIITKDPESVIALFEALGFERTHNKVGDDEIEFSSVRMKDANGFHVDVVETTAISRPQDIMVTRINVDDFDVQKDNRCSLLMRPDHILHILHLNDHKDL